MHLPRNRERLGIIVPAIVGVLMLGLSLAGAVHAVTSGGFPSRPTFQTIATSGTGTIATCGNVTNVGTCFNGQTAHWATEVNGSSSASNSFGLVIAAGTNSSDRGLQIENQAGTLVYFRVDGAGNITAPSAASVPWAKAWALVTVSGACVINRSSGISGCTYNGAGDTTLTFSTSNPSPGAACTAASADNLSSVAISAFPGSLTTEEVKTKVSNTAAAADKNYSIVCF